MLISPDLNAKSMANRKAGCTGPVVDILCMANRSVNLNGLKNAGDTGDIISTSFKKLGSSGPQIF